MLGRCSHISPPARWPCERGCRDALRSGRSHPCTQVGTIPLVQGCRAVRASATWSDPEHISEQKRWIPWSFSHYNRRLPIFLSQNNTALTWRLSADKLG